MIKKIFGLMIICLIAIAIGAIGVISEEQCTDDNYCNEYEFCDDGECEEIDEEEEELECSENSDCDADEFCNKRGKCKEIVVEEPVCIEDSDCKSDEFCNNRGKCKEIDEDLLEKSSKKVKEKIKKSKTTRVIVILNDPEQKEDILKKLKKKHFKLEVDMKTGFAGYATKKGLKKLDKMDGVEVVVEDKVMTIATAQSFPLMKIDKAANVSYNGYDNLTGEGQTVCVIDTGVDLNHDDFGDCVLGGDCPKIVGGWNYFSNNGNYDDDNGHGTAMAGIIAADGVTYKGIAPKANIVALKVTDEFGNGWTSIAHNAIDWCINNKDNLSITTISFGLAYPGVSFNSTSDCDIKGDPVYDSINIAVANGITVFAPTGNDEYTIGIAYPACMTNATSVSAVSDGSMAGNNTPVDEIPSTAAGDSWGPNRYPGMTDLMAPGGLIHVLDLGDSYGDGGGTSFASAHAVGSAILLNEYNNGLGNPQLTPAEIKSILQTTGVGIFDSATSSNYSRIDLLAAIKEGIGGLSDVDGDEFYSDVDCDDNNASINPIATEVCDGVDNNCDGNIDEGFDLDNDGYTTCNGDCNDNDPDLNPDTYWYLDSDGDGFGTSTVSQQQCTQPTGPPEYVLNSTDVDDSNPDIYPGGPPFCFNSVSLTYDSTIQSAYINAGEGSIIKVQAGTFTEELLLDINKSITLQGGYDEAFSTVIGDTTIDGNVTIDNGTISIENFILQ